MGHLFCYGADRWRTWQPFQLGPDHPPVIRPKIPAPHRVAASAFKQCRSVRGARPASVCQLPDERWSDPKVRSKLSHARRTLKATFGLVEVLGEVHPRQSKALLSLS